MQGNRLKKLFLFLWTLFIAHEMSAGGWLSDTLVRVPVIGYYFMSSDQKMIYTYKQQQGTIEKLRKEYSKKNYAAVVALADEIEKKCAWNIPEPINPVMGKGYLVKQRLEDLYFNYGLGNDAGVKKARERIRVGISLTPEQVNAIDDCIENHRNIKAFKEVAYLMQLNGKINSFKTTLLYKNNLLASEKKAIQKFIDTRLEASNIQDGTDLSNKSDAEYKGFKESYKYYSSIMQVFKNIDERHKHINNNLNRLKKDLSNLENSVATYKAIDE